MDIRTHRRYPVDHSLADSPLINVMARFTPSFSPNTLVLPSQSRLFAVAYLTITCLAAHVSAEDRIMC